MVGGRCPVGKSISFLLPHLEQLLNSHVEQTNIVPQFEQEQPSQPLLHVVNRTPFVSAEGHSMKQNISKAIIGTSFLRDKHTRCPHVRHVPSHPRQAILGFSAQSVIPHRKKRVCVNLRLIQSQSRQSSESMGTPKTGEDGAIGID